MPESSRFEKRSGLQVASVDSSGKHSSRTGPWIIGSLVALLLILHQDNWLWNDGRLVLGIMPIGLVWHVCISIGASLTWFLATKIAWPVESEWEVNTADAIAGRDAPVLTKDPVPTKAPVPTKDPVPTNDPVPTKEEGPTK